LNIVYLEASDIVTESQRPNPWVPLASVKEYNQIFNSNYSVESGTAMIVTYDSVKNNGKEIFGDNIQLKDNQQSYSFKKSNTEHNKIFYRYAFGQPVLILVNEEDYSKFYGNMEGINKGKIHLYKYGDWTKSGEAVEKLSEAFALSYGYWNNIQPQEVQSINQKFYGFEVISKYQQYEHNKQVGGFALFIMSFISILFVAAICVLVYFKVLSDWEADKKKIFILSTVGITSKQVRNYLYGKLRMIMVAPILLGSLIAIGFCLSLNIGNTLEWEIPVSSVLHNSFTVAALYWGVYYSIMQY
jgi:ABC-type antimicrobial peptide transport system permease subunit